MARSIRGSLGATALLLVGLSAYVVNSQTPSYATLAEFIASYNGTDLTVFSAALNKTGLTNAVASLNNGTVFIPNDAAFASFATSLGLANAAALLNLSQDMVAALLKFHVVPSKVTIATAADVAQYSKMATMATPAVGATEQQYLSLVANQTENSYSVKSPRATAKFAPISTSAGSPLFTAVGASQVVVVTQVLATWYNSIGEAINDNSRLLSLRSALMQNDMWAELYNTSLSRTLFAPTDGAVDGVRTDFNIDMKSNSTIAKEMLNYMQAVGPLAVNFSADATATYSFTSLLCCNQMITVNQTGANAVTVSSLGSVAKLTTYGTIQVGGPTAKALIHIIGYPLIPTVTNIWAMITKEPNLSVLAGLFLAEGKEYKKLAAITVNGQTTAGAVPYTLLAPMNDAFKIATNKYSANSVADLIGAANLGAFLRNHVVVGSYSTDNLTAGVQLTTLESQTAGTSSKKLAVTANNKTITLAADQSTANIFIKNNQVAYGWSYIHAIDFPLFPGFPFILPPGGSAGAVLPSVAVLLAGLVAAAAAALVV
ncbi:hypothetical protein HYH02_007515 [Chlamydomonas schloesseri]|uniref:FAS1 domain-containing protein n=1 Tax=Chlamydomonas schloesseri TaxID=2026947 RepID=A0A836B4S8_9CHLO|nr:hypothetical protein HYH02_007515 [Chlamydomonas schloesseri]|eukprot:KAG2447592.1 hypothetical protein HYH02_007515 [Chlamydomonas schloesseri]